MQKHEGEKVYSVWEHQWVGMGRVQATGRNVAGFEENSKVGWAFLVDRKGYYKIWVLIQGNVEPMLIELVSLWVRGFGYFLLSSPERQQNDGQFLAIMTIKFLLNWSKF